MGVLSGVNALDTADIPVLATSAIVGSGVVANAAAVAALAAKPGETAFLMGVQVTAAGATAALSTTLTITGLAGGTITYGYTFPAGAGVPAQPFALQFLIALQAAGPNQAITVTLGAGGAGNVSASVTIQGFYL
jgi:hypothetical protein